MLYKLDALDFLMMNAPLNDIRLEYWERKFPGFTDDVGKIFGTHFPTPYEVGKWKDSWTETSPYYVTVKTDITAYRNYSQKKLSVNKICSELGIHPYFWSYYRKSWRETITDQDGKPRTVTFLSPRVSFYFEEHAVMFKLGYHE